MGNSDSKETSYGYRIIKVAPGSPAQKAGLIEFLDYIIDVSTSNDKTPFTGNYGEFFKIVQNSEDKETTMKVYNILYRKTRIVTLIPSKKWENSDSLLGALVRYEEYASAHERALRIATVHPNSPASIAGLEPEIDYVLGSPQYLYTDLNELANFIEMTQEKETIKSLELYIYNSQTNAVRSTLIIPNRNWGGEGHLGCEFALGILNHLPQLEDEIPVSNLGETVPLTGIDTSHTSPLGDKVDRLDESPLQLQPRGLEKTLSEERTLEDQVLNPKPTSSQEPSDLSAAPKSEAIPEFKLRPPTSSEVEHNKAAHDAHGQKPTNFDLSHELTNQRMKLLNLGHQYKVPSKGPQRPVIKSGRSTANPFHNPEDTPTKNGGLSSPFPQVAQVSHEQPVHEKTVAIEEAPVVKSEDHSASVVTQPSENAASQPHQHAHEQVHQEPQQVHEQVKEQVHEHIPEQNLEKEKSARKPVLAEVETKPQVEKVEEKKPEPEVKKIELNGNSRMYNETPVVMRVEKTPSSPVKEMRRLISNEEVKTENNGKPIHGGETQEKHAYRTTIEYNFFSKKLSGEYKILSSNLFDLDAPLKAKNSK